jgi:hypothetical protein
MKLRFFILVPIFFSALASAQASRKMPIRENIEVRSQVVTLGDLTIADLMSDADRQLPITAAPQLDSTRTLSRREFSALLLGHNQNPSDFAIPERIQITRWSRALSRDELATAIRGALLEQKMTVDFAGDLQGGAKVGIADPRIQVTSIDLRRSENAIRFRLKIVNEPELHEFWVSSRLSQSVMARSVSIDLRPARSITSLPKAARAVVLARSMKPAALVVYGRGFQFTTSVTPLQNGSRGDVIRVREEATGRILKAEVVGPSQLQIGDQVANKE